MLTLEDKQWLSEMIDEKMDARFAVQDAKLQGEMEQMGTSLRSEMEEMSTSLRSEMEQMGTSLRRDMEEMNAKLRQDLEQTINRKAVVFRRAMNERIDQAEERIERYFDIIIENRILPMINEHFAVLPGAYKSYDLLEERVRKLEDDQVILKIGMASRL